VQVYPVTDYEELDLVKGRMKDAPVTVRGSLQAMTADAALRQLGLEVRNPHRLYVNLQDADAFLPGYLVTFGQEVYAVRGVMKRRTSLLAHAVVVLERLEVGML
jgi:hypothetical protein